MLFSICARRGFCQEAFLCDRQEALLNPSAAVPWLLLVLEITNRFILTPWWRWPVQATGHCRDRNWNSRVVSEVDRWVMNRNIYRRWQTPEIYTLAPTCVNLGSVFLSTLGLGSLFQRKWWITVVFLKYWKIHLIHNRCWRPSFKNKLDFRMLWKPQSNEMNE